MTDHVIAIAELQAKLKQATAEQSEVNTRLQAANDAQRFVELARSVVQSEYRRYQEIVAELERSISALQKEPEPSE